MNLDERIEQKRRVAQLKESLDVNWYDDTVDIYTIYADIVNEASAMKPVGKGKYVKYSFSGFSIITKMRSMDEKMKQYRFYRLFVRKVLQKIYKLCKMIKGRKSIPVKQVLCYENEEFVAACYNILFEREPGNEEIEHWREKLGSKEMCKLEVAYQISDSQEARIKEVKFKGKKCKLFFLRFYRKLF